MSQRVRTGYLEPSLQVNRQAMRSHFQINSKRYENWAKIFKKITSKISQKHDYITYRKNQKVWHRWKRRHFHHVTSVLFAREMVSHRTYDITFVSTIFFKI